MATRTAPDHDPPAPAAAPVASCTGLRKRYGDRVAVDGVSFAIAAGECYGLLGPNGAGKTTTVSMVCGLTRRDGGEVVVAGHSIDADAGAAKAAIGYVPQDIALYPDLTARENLRFFGRLYSLRGADLAARTEHVLALTGLADRGNDRIDTYSGGMKRRVNIAAGLLHGPRLLILDEPTVGVDPQSRHAILSTVEELAAGGLAVLYTTHYMEEAQRLCRRIGILDEGRLVAEGTHADLVALVGERDRVHLDASGPLARFAAACRRIDGVDDAVAGEGTADVFARGAGRILSRVLEAAEQAGVTITGVDVIEPDLEAVFLHLTGKALRD